MSCLFRSSFWLSQASTANAIHSTIKVANRCRNPRRSTYASAAVAFLRPIAISQTAPHTSFPSDVTVVGNPRNRPKNIFLDVEAHLRDGHKNRALYKFSKSISSRAIALEDLPTAYERAILLFCHYGDISSALALYHQFTRGGFAPRLSIIDALIRGVRLSPSPDISDLTTIWTVVLNCPVHLDNSMLDTFLSNLVLALPYAQSENILRQYSTARGAQWRMSSRTYSSMIRAYCDSGNMDVARKWLDHYRAQYSQALPHELGAPLGPPPYVALLAGLAKIDPLDAEPLYEISRMMSADGINPNTITYNIILAAESRLLRVTRVFALYRVMRRRRSHNLVPDAFTFATLFKTCDRWSSTLFPRQIRPSPSPRQLFRHMLEEHHIRTKGRPSRVSNVLTTSVLNIALEYFIRTRDYAAAIVVLRTFAVCRIHINARTHWAVVIGIIRRLRSELAEPTDSSSTWSHRFVWQVHGQDNDLIHAGLSEETLNRLIEFWREGKHSAILQATRQAKLQPWLAKLLRATSIATSRSMKNPPVVLRSDLDLLRRCVFSSLGIVAPNGTQSSSQAQEGAFSRVMRAVNEEMLPLSQGRKWAVDSEAWG